MEFLVATDERGQPFRMCRLEAALDCSLANDAPDLSDARETLQLVRAGIDALECTSDEAPGRLADHHLARSSQRLKPGSQIGRLAHHRLLSRGTLADEVADDDQ